MDDASDGSLRRPLVATKRYVAVCDVLGFSAQLKIRGLRWMADRYSELESEIRDLYKWEVGAQIFSDTVLLYSEPLDGLLAMDEGDVVRDAVIFAKTTGFLGYTASLITTGLTLGLPFRAGVSFGDCVIDTRRDVFLGEPIVDAYLTEQSQDWIGVGVSNATFQWHAGTVHDGDFWRLIHWQVPVKPGAPVQVVNWSINWSNVGLGREHLGETLASFHQENRGTKHEARWQRTLDFYRAAASRPLEQGGCRERQVEHD